MEIELTQEFLFAVIVLVIVGVLVGLDKLSQENFMQIILLIIGGFLGYAAGYLRARLKLHQKKGLGGYSKRQF